jgi:hypothetical protein
MRKSAIACLVGLTRAWEPIALQDAQRASNVSAQLVHAYKNYVFEQALPLCLGGIATGYTVDTGASADGGNAGTCTSSSAASEGSGADQNSKIENTVGLVLNLQDAQTQNIVIEVASFVYAVVGAYGKEDTVRYLQNALPAFNWGSHATQGVLNLIMTTNNDVGSPQGGQPYAVFRDSFKKIFRDCRR